MKKTLQKSEDKLPKIFEKPALPLIELDSKPKKNKQFTYLFTHKSDAERLINAKLNRFAKILNNYDLRKSI